MTLLTQQWLPNADTRRHGAELLVPLGGSLCMCVCSHVCTCELCCVDILPDRALEAQLSELGGAVTSRTVTVLHFGYK